MLNLDGEMLRPAMILLCPEIPNCLDAGRTLCPTPESDVKLCPEIKCMATVISASLKGGGGTLSLVLECQLNSKLKLKLAAK